MSARAFNLLHLGLLPRLALAAGLISLVWAATLWAAP
jgi:hypothetical protein